MEYTAKKEKLKGDLKTFLYDLRNVYPATFKIILKYELIACQVIMLIYASFFLDNIIRSQFSQIHNSIFDFIFSFGHWYGDGSLTYSLFLLLYIGGIFFLNDKFRDTGLLIAESFIFSGLISLSVKSFFGRWRPYTGHGSLAFLWFTFGPNDHLSFPSGHATVAFALSSVAAGATSKVYLKVFYYFLAIITAFSRIYHDQHWFSDVFLSSVIGVLFGRVLVYLHNNVKLNKI